MNAPDADRDGSEDIVLRGFTLEGNMQHQERPADGEITFAFQKLEQRDVPDAVVRRWGRDFVGWCFTSNTQVPQ